MFGDKNFFGLYRSVGRFFAHHGAVAVCVNYRLSPRVRHPEHVKDVARAFVWVRAHVKDYGGDPDRILLCGHSAGGHIVSLLATDQSYLNNPHLRLSAADRASIKGVMSVCGVYRIPTPDEFAVMMGDMVNGLLQSTGNKMIAPATLAPYVLGPSRVLNPFRLVFGGDYGAAAKAAPLTHVHKGLPPFLVLYAGRELPMLGGMAVEFAKALKDAGDAVELQRIDNCTHNNILFKLNQTDDPAAAALLAFLGKYGGPAVGVKP
jgi:acetyl esterase/lipase